MTSGAKIRNIKFLEPQDSERWMPAKRMVKKLQWH